MSAAALRKLAVTYLPVAAVKPAARNPRTHTPEQIAQIAAAIGQWGWTNPILVDEGGVIVAGHGRLDAARLLAMDEVPTITLTGLTAEDKEALRTADNKLALNAGWDDDLLKIVLGELGDAGYDTSAIGFSDEEMAAILGGGADPADELEDTLESDRDDEGAFRSIVVRFKDQGAVDEFARTIGQAIGDETRSTWFPRLERAGCE